MQEEKRKQEIQAKLLAWDELEAELEKATADNRRLTQVNQKVGQLVEEGIIKQNEDDSFVAVVDPLEREFIQNVNIKRRQSLNQSAANVSNDNQSASQDPDIDRSIDVDLDLEWGNFIWIDPPDTAIHS